VTSFESESSPVSADDFIAVTTSCPWYTRKWLHIQNLARSATNLVRFLASVAFWYD